MQYGAEDDRYTNAFFIHHVSINIFTPQCADVYIICLGFEIRFLLFLLNVITLTMYASLFI